MTCIRPFSARIIPICHQKKKLIFGISEKIWVDLCVFQSVSLTLFFGQIFPPSPPHPQGYMKKWFSSKQLFYRLVTSDLSKNSILQLSNLFSTVQISVLVKLMFSRIPEGIKGENLTEKESQKQYETYIDRLSFLCWFQIWYLFEMK